MPDTLEKKRVFVVVAAFNEARTIQKVVEDVRTRYPDVIVVDDGSSDRTAEYARMSEAMVLCHFINRGQGAALQTGIQFALIQGADVIVTFDADGQHSVDDIPQLVAPILCGDCDAALGSRFLGSAHDIPWSRRLILKLGILFTRIVSDIAVTDVHNGLRALSREAAAAIHINLDRMAHASDILDQIQKGGWRYKEVPVNIYYSPYSLAKGQSSFGAIQICFDVLIGRLSG